MLELFGEHGGELLLGLRTTVLITAVAFTGSVVIGTVLAVMRISPVAPLRVAATVYVEFFRNVPLVALVVLTVYGLPKVGYNPGFLLGVISATTAVGAAFACETLRTGVNAVGVGQIEAARSIGMTFPAIVGQVVLPQAARTVIGPAVTLFIGILLSSSMAAVVGQPDLTFMASQINNQAALGLITFIVVAAAYALMSLAAAGVGAALERRLRVQR